ncbi:DUF4912 domain-containing protein [Neobacillus sp. SAB-20_R2A]|uniref:DUF4912 domain-containing protein n=1 Tax=Neobacillus sp. SAB-20_R2A TaxID=3120519 RepID=UPI003C6DE780
MINEIIELRRKGLSFRKIAVELNTTVGKVQYSWNKWMESENQDNSESLHVQKNMNQEKSSVTSTPQTFVPLKGELTAKLVTPQKMFLYWDFSETPKKIVRLYFNQPFEELVTVLRVYDVKDIIFNGKNAHHYYEITVPYQNGYWFVKGLTGNRSFIAELGVLLPETGFFPLYRSNCIQTPAAEIPSGNELHQDLLQFKRYEDRPPKWRNHVSTYSYYEESTKLENKNA